MLAKRLKIDTQRLCATFRIQGMDLLVSALFQRWQKTVTVSPIFVAHGKD